MRAGETYKAITVNIPELERLGQTLARLAKHVAIMDCDVLVTQEGRVSVLELNPRFGGGYPTWQGRTSLPRSWRGQKDVNLIQHGSRFARESLVRSMIL